MKPPLLTSEPLPQITPPNDAEPLLASTVSVDAPSNTVPLPDSAPMVSDSLTIKVVLLMTATRLLSPIAEPPAIASVPPPSTVVSPV